MRYEGIDDCLMHKGAAAKGQQLGRQLTCCGTECTECGFYENVCAGCNESCGRVFHAPEGKACPIYDCAVNRKKRTSCAQCKNLPCEIWKTTRDPALSEQEFAESIRKRIENLQEVLKIEKCAR